MTAYYNEIDPFAAQWLRNLIDAGHIARGDVDERDIREVQPDDIKQYTQVHLFAGIGGWSYALRLAGWPDDRAVWTGSCPCQPFSNAGKQLGTADDRHLWPEMFRLIRECRPAIVFGEQVASAVGHGWVDGVFADLEAEAYTCGAIVLGAHSVGAPHIRQRLWWVADAQCSERRAVDCSCRDARGVCIPQRQEGPDRAGSRGEDGRLADAVPAGWAERRAFAGSGSVAGGGSAGGLGDADDAGSQGHGQPVECPGQRTAWTPSGLVHCTDGKSRRVEPGTFPLAHGVPGRVGRLRAYGNAIVPQVAAEFVTAYMECCV